MLSSYGFTPTGIETLGKKLSGISIVTLSSNKLNKILRLYDMMLTIIRKRKSTHYVIIDTYSGLAFCYAFACAMLCRLIGLSYLPILRGGDLPKMLIKIK